MTALLVALAGGIGAACRFVLDGFVPRPHGFPWGTALVNVIGSFALGLLVGSAAGPSWVTIAGTGLLGGFTTFSTASVELLRLIEARRYRIALAYGGGSIAVCLAAATAGLALT